MMLNSMPAAAMALVAIAAVQSPLLACTISGGGVNNSVAVHALASEINERGFDDLSRIAGGWQDAVVSPFSTWYLNRFVDAHWGGPPTDAARQLIALIQSHRTFSGTVWPDRQTTTFTGVDASTALAQYCATTNWDPWPPTSKPDDPNGKDLTVSLSLKGSFTFPTISGRQFATLPYYNHSPFRGVRLDSPDGKTALFLLWGTADGIESFRTSMNVSQWGSISKQFAPVDVLMDGLAFQRQAESRWDPDGLTSFDTTIVAGLRTKENLHVSSAGAKFVIDAFFHGFSMKPKKVIVNGKTEYQTTEYTIISDPGSTIAPERRLSTLPPLVYVLEDISTGVILIAGVHK